MAIRIVTADERLSAAANKTSFAIFGPPGAGKTTLLKSLPADSTLSRGWGAATIASPLRVRAPPACGAVRRPGPRCQSACSPSRKAMSVIRFRRAA